MQEKEAAVYSALQQIEQVRTHGSEMTEVEVWLETLEAAHFLLLTYTRGGALPGAPETEGTEANEQSGNLHC